MVCVCVGIERNDYNTGSNRLDFFAAITNKNALSRFQHAYYTKSTYIKENL